MAKKKNITQEESRNTLNIMANDEFKTDFITLLKTRYPLFYITTNEERRFLQFMNHFSRAKGYQCYLWDCFNGLVDISSGNITEGSDDSLKEPITILEHIINEGKGYVNKRDAISKKEEDGVKGIIYILLDFFRFVQEDPDIERRLKSVSNLDGIVSTIITGPIYQSTNVVENLMPVIDFPNPNKEEIKSALWQVVNSVKGKIIGITKKTQELEEDLINAVSGLTLMQSQTAFAKSIVAHKGWDIPVILDEKKQIIRKSGILDFYNNTVSINDVGGLKNLINWIKRRKECFSQEAMDYGLQKPRGLLTIGMPGCGKSLVCKAISGAWEMPLLRLDFGKLFDSLIGQSEARARDALKLAESIAPCVLWIDEIEKGLSGVNSSGKTDGGTTSRVLSTFLTWMQEKKSSVFVVATANDHASIPAEFLRAGRFDEIFFVDLPNETERKEIFKVLLRKRSYNIKDFNIDALASKTNSRDYSGAEIEKAIDNAMLVGFEDNRRKIRTKDILSELKKFVPLFKMRTEDFEDLREWADSRCLKANFEDQQKVNLGLRTKKDLDLDLE